MTCLNFAGTGSRILLHSVSLCRRVIPWQKIALNLNREVNYWELVWRPWCDQAANCYWLGRLYLACMYEKPYKRKQTLAEMLPPLQSTLCIGLLWNEFTFWKQTHCSLGMFYSVGGQASLLGMHLDVLATLPKFEFKPLIIYYKEHIQYALLKRL